MRIPWTNSTQKRINSSNKITTSLDSLDSLSVRYTTKLTIGDDEKDENNSKILEIRSVSSGTQKLEQNRQSSSSSQISPQLNGRVFQTIGDDDKDEKISKLSLDNSEVKQSHQSSSSSQTFPDENGSCSPEINNRFLQKCYFTAQSPSATPSPIRRPQPPPIHLSGENVSPAQARRSIWVPRQFAFAGPNSMSMHQRQIQQRQMLANGIMQSNDQKYNYQQKLRYRPNLSVTRSNSSAANNNSFPQTTFNNLAENNVNNTGSLPRLCNESKQVGSTSTILNGRESSVGRELSKHMVLEQQHLVDGSEHSSSSTAAEMQLKTEWSEQQRRRLYRIALNFFNKNPDHGIQLLIRWGFVEGNPLVIARLFRERRGLSRQMIGEYLGTLRSTFHKKVLEHFISDIPMHNVEIDVALRQLLKHFRLPGEAQKIDHIIHTFAHSYVAYNPDKLDSTNSIDTMYILAFAIIMLNTDLHTPSLKDSKRMKLDEFINNLCRVEEGKNLDKKMLACIYERIKEFEFRTDHDHMSQVMKIDQCIISKEKPKLTEPHRRLISHCIVHQIFDPSKRQSSSAHLREIILFNDVLLVCKLVGGRKRSPSSSGNRMDQYQLRYFSVLIGLQVQEFQNSLYQNAFMLNFPDGETLMFNAKNNEDRYCFVTDIRESIAESTEMEQWRISFALSFDFNSNCI